MTIRHAYEAIARDHLRKNDIQLTGASMTFEEWWEEYWPTPTEPSVCDAVLKDLAQKVWNAATAAERERCARVAEGVDRLRKEAGFLPQRLYDTLRRDIAAEIRRSP